MRSGGMNYIGKDRREDFISNLYVCINKGSIVNPHSLNYHICLEQEYKSFLWRKFSCERKSYEIVGCWYLTEHQSVGWFKSDKNDKLDIFLHFRPDSEFFGKWCLKKCKILFDTTTLHWENFNTRKVKVRKEIVRFFPQLVVQSQNFVETNETS